MAFSNRFLDIHRENEEEKEYKSKEFISSDDSDSDAPLTTNHRVVNEVSDDDMQTVSSTIRGISKKNRSLMIDSGDESDIPSVRRTGADDETSNVGSQISHNPSQLSRSSQMTRSSRSRSRSSRSRSGLRSRSRSSSRSSRGSRSRSHSRSTSISSLSSFAMSNSGVSGSQLTNKETISQATNKSDDSGKKKGKARTREKAKRVLESGTESDISSVKVSLRSAKNEKIKGKKTDTKKGKKLKIVESSDSGSSDDDMPLNSKLKPSESKSVSSDDDDDDMPLSSAKSTKRPAVKPSNKRAVSAVDSSSEDEQPLSTAVKSSKPALKPSNKRAVSAVDSSSEDEQLLSTVVKSSGKPALKPSNKRTVSAVASSSDDERPLSTALKSSKKRKVEGHEKPPGD